MRIVHNPDILARSIPDPSLIRLNLADSLKHVIEIALIEARNTVSRCIFRSSSKERRHVCEYSCVERIDVWGVIVGAGLTFDHGEANEGDGEDDEDDDDVDCEGDSVVAAETGIGREGIGVDDELGEDGVFGGRVVDGVRVRVHLVGGWVV